MRAVVEAIAVALLPPILLIGVSLSCGLLESEPRFADAADLVCEGLEDFGHLHNTILTVHLLMERGDYAGALRVADELLRSIDESKEVEGMRELRALIFLLESVVREAKPNG